MGSQEGVLEIVCRRIHISQKIKCGMWNPFFVSTEVCKIRVPIE